MEDAGQSRQEKVNQLTGSEPMNGEVRGVEMEDGKRTKEKITDEKSTEDRSVEDNRIENGDLKAADPDEGKAILTAVLLLLIILLIVTLIREVSSSPKN